MESLRFRRGFTLIELMVVLAIMTVIMTIVLANQSSFNKTLILANAAYDIALTLRFAEAHGLGSRAVGTASNVAYGVHLVRGSQNSFILFADTVPATSCGTPDCKAGDHVYADGADALVQTYMLGNGMTISDFCAQSTGSWSCAAAGGLTSLDIVFERPNPDPFMSANGLYSATFPVTAACLTVSSPQGGARFVSIAASGQIIPNAASCP